MSRSLKAFDLDPKPDEVFFDAEIKQRALAIIAQQLEVARLSISDQWDRKGRTVLGALSEEGSHRTSKDSLVISFELTLNAYERATVPGAVELQRAAKADLTLRNEGQIDTEVLLLMQQRALIDARLRTYRG